MWKKVKDFLVELLFPAFCLNCQKEGSYLCQDCQALLNISGFHQKYAAPNLKDLYFPLSYQNPLAKKLIQQFKYEPFIKELAKTLSSLIIAHFKLLDNKPDFSDFLLIPLPLDKKRLRWRGFNQSREIAEELAISSGPFLGLEVSNNVLIKTKATLPQMELSDEQRKENVKGAFEIKDKGEVLGKKILLIDDVYTTGSTTEEASRILKTAGAKEIVGVVIARG